MLEDAHKVSSTVALGCFFKRVATFGTLGKKGGRKKHLRRAVSLRDENTKSFWGGKGDQVGENGLEQTFGARRESGASCSRENRAPFSWEGNLRCKRGTLLLMTWGKGPPREGEGLSERRRVDEGRISHKGEIRRGEREGTKISEGEGSSSRREWVAGKGERKMRRKGKVGRKKGTAFLNLKRGGPFGDRGGDLSEKREKPGSSSEKMFQASLWWARGKRIRRAGEVQIKRGSFSVGVFLGGEGGPLSNENSRGKGW